MVPGALDFDRPVREGGLVLYRRYQRPAQWALVPHALDIATNAAGAPDFHLALVRSRSAGLAAYGVVDFRVTPVLDLETASKAVTRIKAKYFVICASLSIAPGPCWDRQTSLSGVRFVSSGRVASARLSREVTR